MFLLQVSNMQATKKKHSNMSADNPERSTENLFFRLIRSDAEYQAVLFGATGVFNKRKWQKRRGRQRIWVFVENFRVFPRRIWLITKRRQQQKEVSHGAVQNICTASKHEGRHSWKDSKDNQDHHKNHHKNMTRTKAIVRRLRVKTRRLPEWLVNISFWTYIRFWKGNSAIWWDGQVPLQRCGSLITSNLFCLVTSNVLKIFSKLWTCEVIFIWPGFLLFVLLTLIFVKVNSDN